MESHSRPNQPKGIRRKQLECPFTWGVPVLSDEALELEYDLMWLASDTWSLVLNKLSLAYQHFIRNDLKNSKKFLAECYIPLVQVRGFYESDSDLVEQYWTALKHVIDSTWAFVCCKTTPVKDMEAFLQSITPYSSMSDSQKSAVRGIHGKFISTSSLMSLKTAITLNPNEGQWHLYTGILMHGFTERTDLTALISREAALEELKFFKNSYSLRVTPQSTIIYGSALAGASKLVQRTSDIRKGLKLLRDALEKWPTNPYVNYKCGQVFHDNVCNQEDLYLVERCLRKTIKLIGHHECKLACRELGIFLMSFNKIDEGKMYMQAAETARFH